MPDPIFRLPPDWELSAATVRTARTDWSIDFLGIVDLWRQFTGKNLRICVLDTGVDWKHPDLKDAIADAKDFTRSLSGPSDRAGHGSWCLSAIGARGKQTDPIHLRGILPECTLFSGKVLGDSGTGNEETIGRGLEWAESIDAHIVSMSLGGPMMSEGLHSVFQKFVSRASRFIVCAAGNAGRPNDVDYPARWPESIRVGANDKQGRPTNFSNKGELVDVFAPGYQMLGCVPIDMGGYALMSGTSMACPCAAAVLGMALEKHLTLGGRTSLNTVEDARNHLRKSATDKGEYRLLNPAALIESLKEPDKAREYKFFGATIHFPSVLGDSFSVLLPTDSVEKVESLMRKP